MDMPRTHFKDFVWDCLSIFCILIILLEKNSIEISLYGGLRFQALLCFICSHNPKHLYSLCRCEDAEAFEVQDGGKSTGIFTKYLNKHILLSEKVTHVLEKASEGWYLYSKIVFIYNLMANVVTNNFQKKTLETVAVQVWTDIKKMCCSLLGVSSSHVFSSSWQKMSGLFT